MTDLLITLSISDWLNAEYLFTMFMEKANYWIVFVCMAVESSFLPFPSEIVVPPAVYVGIQRGTMNPFAIVAVATAGALVGALFNYYLAVWVGRPIVYRFAESRIGRMCLLDRAKVDRAEAYFDKHGAISTFVGRLLPAVRQLISIPAGLARMNIGKFVLYTALGAGLWNAVLALLGFFLSKIPEDKLFENIEKYNSYLTWGGVAVIGLFILYAVWRGFRKKKV